MLVLEGLVGLHRTVQLQLLQHYWLGHRLGLLCYCMVCLGNEQRSGHGSSLDFKNSISHGTGRRLLSHQRHLGRPTPSLRAPQPFEIAIVQRIFFEVICVCEETLVTHDLSDAAAAAAAAESSIVLLEEGVCYDQCILIAKIY